MQVGSIGSTRIPTAIQVAAAVALCSPIQSTPRQIRHEDRSIHRFGETDDERGERLKEIDKQLSSR